MSIQTDPLISIQNVSKTYSHSNKPALENINLEILEGKNIGLIGSNGSGKTTLLRLIMNYIKPNQGNIIFRDQTNLEKAHQSIGFVGESQEGLENFTPRELFNMSAKMIGMDKEQANSRTTELLEFSGLNSVADNLIEGFSKGMAQRTLISLAILHNPSILLLDEPMSGLDYQAQKEIKDFLNKLTNHTLIYASHNLEEIEEFTSEIIFLHKGRIVKQLSLEKIHQEVFILEIDQRVKSLLEKFKHFNPEIINEGIDTVEIRILVDIKNFQDFVDYCKKENINIHRIRSRSILEDTYQKYISKTPL